MSIGCSYLKPSFRASCGRMGVGDGCIQGDPRVGMPTPNSTLTISPSVYQMPFIHLSSVSAKVTSLTHQQVSKSRVPFMRGIVPVS